MYLYQNGLSHVKIAAMFGRGRSTVTCGIRTAKNLISTKEEWALFCYGKLNIKSQETKHIRQLV
jgi:phage regulator Rha-like protein